MSGTFDNYAVMDAADSTWIDQSLTYPRFWFSSTQKLLGSVRIVNAPRDDLNRDGAVNSGDVVVVRGGVGGGSTDTLLDFNR